MKNFPTAKKSFWDSVKELAAMRKNIPKERRSGARRSLEPTPIDITVGSRWKHRKTKRVLQVVAGFRPEPPPSTYVLESRKASRDDGDDTYEELARGQRELRQQILYRYVKKVGRHIPTCSITVERFLQTFVPV